MGKRYVFFRDSNGRAYRGLDGKHAPTNLLSQMGKSSILQEDGRIGWRRWFHQYDALLSSALVLESTDVELNDRDTQRILWKALEDVAKKAPGKPLNAAEVLRAGDIHAGAFFRQPFKKYFVVTSLSVKAFPAKVVTIRGNIVKPLKQRGKRYPFPKVLESARHRGQFAEHLKASRYQLIRIGTEGRSVFEAVAKALESLNLLRALWSFEAILGRWTMRFGGGRKPIGVIHTGPVYTLHNLDGSVVNDEHYWFDPNYIGDLELFQENNKWGQLEKDRRWAIRRLSRLPYRKELEDLFLRYIAALDQSNPNVAFLQLWGILEKLTDTVSGPYDDTIKRTCWVYAKKDRPAMKETLEALRHHRNRYVHSGNAAEENEEITYQIKSFVDPHLVRLLNNSFKVHSLQEYGEFLSYPTDIKKLEQVRSWSSRALSIARDDEQEDELAHCEREGEEA